MTKLTVGMATYQEPDNVWGTLHSTRLCQKVPEGWEVEYLVVDNSPDGCIKTQQRCEGFGARYIHAPNHRGTAAPRDLVFREATGDIVLCVDCHVVLKPGALESLIRFYDDPEVAKDMVQGPVYFDNHATFSTHLRPEWDDRMFGKWTSDPRLVSGKPFRIGMHGLGLFAMRKEHWVGFNPLFVGFGGEEGYVQAKVRKMGGKVWCVPGVGWVHQWRKRHRTPYPNIIEERIFNYIVGWREVGLNTDGIKKHFTEMGDTVAYEEALKRADALLPLANKNTGISCLCPTYAKAGTPRQILLEEAVESFIRQDYRESELIIVNDDPHQTLKLADSVVDSDRIRIINLPARFKTLGEKRNFMFGVSKYDNFAIWDDDDISLPNRLSVSMRNLQTAEYYNPAGYWYIEHGGEPQHQHKRGVSVNACALTRTAVNAVKGFEHTSHGEDLLLHIAITTNTKLATTVHKGSTPESWTYIYRWGESRHVSAAEDINAQYTSMAKFAGPAGTYTLTPQWRTDYSRLIQTQLEKIK